jgi:hypothetical protein
MKTLRYAIAATALLLAGALLSHDPVEAATAAATASATIISPTDITNEVAADLLQRASSGLFSLGIPRALCTTYRCDAEVEAITLSSIWMRGTTIVFSTSDSTPKASLVLALAQSAKGMNGILSTGQGVNLFVTHTELDDSGRGRVYAIIAYN